MNDSERTWTIWEITADKDERHYRLRINSIGGPAGNTATIKITRNRMHLLLDFYNVQEVSDLKARTFQSSELNAAAALYDFLLKVLQFD